jgi:hypothetical protein
MSRGTVILIVALLGVLSILIYGERNKKEEIYRDSPLPLHPSQLQALAPMYHARGTAPDDVFWGTGEIDTPDKALAGLEEQWRANGGDIGINPSATVFEMTRDFAVRQVWEKMLEAGRLPQESYEAAMVLEGHMTAICKTLDEQELPQATVPEGMYQLTTEGWVRVGEGE